MEHEDHSGTLAEARRLLEEIQRHFGARIEVNPGFFSPMDIDIPGVCRSLGALSSSRLEVTADTGELASAIEQLELAEREVQQRARAFILALATPDDAVEVLRNAYREAAIKLGNCARAVMAAQERAKSQGWGFGR